MNFELIHRLFDAQASYLRHQKVFRDLRDNMAAPESTWAVDEVQGDDSAFEVRVAGQKLRFQFELKKRTSGYGGQVQVFKMHPFIPHQADLLGEFRFSGVGFVEGLSGDIDTDDGLRVSNVDDARVILWKFASDAMP